MKAQEFAACWDSLGLPRPWREGTPAGAVTIRSPVDGEAIGHVPACTPVGPTWMSLIWAIVKPCRASGRPATGTSTSTTRASRRALI
ncbi:hypothetical protein AU476_21550 [Cupriavidus sp. UYMSc13B]|nr:hypothetical protein AU476_21550 [Cupriavidus sp. UYMSc13B]